MADPYQPPGTSPGPNRTGPLYSVQGIVVGTVLGSLAAGVVMLAINYRTLGKRTLAAQIGLWGGVACAGFVGASMLAPNSPLLGVVFISLQGLLAYIVADRLQGAAIDYHRSHDGLIHSNLRAAGVGFLTGMAILFALLTLGILWAALSGMPPPTGSTP